MDRRRVEQCAALPTAPYDRLDAAHGGRAWGDSDDSDFRYHAPEQSTASRVRDFYSHFPLLNEAQGGAPQLMSQALASALGMASPTDPVPWRFARLRHGPPPPLAAPEVPEFASNGPVGWVLAHFFTNEGEVGAEEGQRPPLEAAAPPTEALPSAAGGGGGGAAAARSAAASRRAAARQPQQLAAGEEIIALPAHEAPPRLPSVFLGLPF